MRLSSEGTNRTGEGGVKRFRFITVCLAATFIVAGAAYGFAQAPEERVSDVHTVPKPSAPPKEPGPGAAVGQAARTKQSDEASRSDQGERKKNHGYYVSSAAHCEDVDDPSTQEKPDFAAPEDCSSNGEAHGLYVRAVARSAVGKPSKANKPDRPAAS